MNVKPKVIIILVVLMITAIAVQLYRGDVILKIFSVDQAIDNDLKTTDLNFFTGANFSTTKTIKIGCRHGLAYFFAGNIEDIRIYNRVLSQEERTFLYKSYRPSLVAG